jgi:uncharacterized protein with GYD domain
LQHEQREGAVSGSGPIKTPATADRLSAQADFHEIAASLYTFPAGLERRDPMPKYVLLANFTDQGIRNIRGTIGRAEAFQAMAEKSGIVMKELCWTLGRHDVVAVFEAADDESATALALSAASLGNVRCETLRAFSFDEMRRTLSKMV